MSARREYENWDQPSVFNSTLNEMFYGDLRGPNTYGYDDLMLQSNTVLNNEDVQVFHEETYQDYQELSTARQNFIPPPMEPPLPGATPSEGVAANRHLDSENEEVANDVGLPMEDYEMQLEGPIPSSSNTGAGPGKQKNPKKKREEGGECGPCNKVFSRISDARRHKRTVHKGKRDQPIVCKLCKSKLPPFSRTDALRRHMLNQHGMPLVEDQS